VKAGWNLISYTLSASGFKVRGWPNFGNPNEHSIAFSDWEK